MQYRAWTQINFDAGHAPVENPCPDTSGPHGHRYSVRAYLEGPYDPLKRTPLGEVRQAMHALRAELQGTIIDTMLPGVFTNPAGIAAWVLERVPKVSAVMVSTESDEAVEVHR